MSKQTAPTRSTGQTPSQTVGPYYHLGLASEAMAVPSVVGNDLLPGGSPDGGAITIAGRLLDGQGAGVADGLIELWQADPQGHYGGPDFAGFGRAQTDGDGRFSFRTVKPGRVSDGQNRMQAPHLNLTVFARGLLNHAFTRCYFPDDEATADDPILALVPEARRPTLIAAGGDGVYRFDIHLQGPSETVFFDL